MRAVMRTIALILTAALMAAPAWGAGPEKGLTVKGVRFFSYAGFTRIVFETEQAAPYVLTRSGDGRSVYFSSYGGPFTLEVPRLPVVDDGVVKSLEPRQDGNQKAITISLGPSAGEIKDFVLHGPNRIVVDVLRGTPPAAPQARTAVVIVIDPGHGGADTGIMTGQGPEKAQTLELANALRKALRKSGAKYTIMLTREQDQFLSLDDRAATANAAEATLFVSLHLSPGAEQHVLILDPDEGQALPATGGRGDFLGFDALSEQQQLLWGTQQAEHARESGRLGRAIARALTDREGAEPDQAPLALLRPLASAAVMVETGAAQNRLNTAEAIARGIEQYVREKR
jgi:N-acetylmuramoyl-L-alanine amidase